MSKGCTGEQPNGATLDKLHALLEEQLRLLHQGRLEAAESLCEQTGQLVYAAVASGALAGPDGNDRRQSLQQLYRELCLALTAEKEETSASLRRVRRGKRMLRAYGQHAF